MRLVVKITVALILGLAGIIKLGSPTAFALDIANYQLLPDALIQPVAYFVPVLELVVVFALFRKELEDAAWLLSGAMFLGFGVAVGSAVVRGLDISCGCFGEALTVSWYHLLANAIAALLCLWAYAHPPRSTVSNP